MRLAMCGWRAIAATAPDAGSGQSATPRLTAPAANTSVRLTSSASSRSKSAALSGSSLRSRARAFARSPRRRAEARRASLTSQFSGRFSAGSWRSTSQSANSGKPAMSGDGGDGVGGGRSDRRQRQTRSNDARVEPHMARFVPAIHAVATHTNVTRGWHLRGGDDAWRFRSDMGRTAVPSNPQ